MACACTGHSSSKSFSAQEKVRSVLEKNRTEAKFVTSVVVVTGKSAWGEGKGRRRNIMVLESGMSVRWFCSRGLV